MADQKANLIIDSNISPEYVVTQSNNLISTPQNLNLQEKRIILTLASLIQPDDENFRIHRIKVKDLADMIGISNQNFYAKVEEVVQGLQNKHIIIEDEHRKLTVSWLSSSEYFKGQGIVELEFSEKLRPYLLQLSKNYTPFKLRNVLSLQSEYSIRLYELLKQYEKLKSRTLTIDELKFKLNISPEKYKMYGHLKSRVILKAQKELAEKTDLAFDFEEIRMGRKVIRLKFHIRKNRKVITELLATGLEEDTYALLVRVGIRPAKARSLLKQFSEDQIKANVHYVLANKKKADIDNISGYIISAIENDYSSSDLDNSSPNLAPIDILGNVYQFIKKQYKNDTGVIPGFLLESDVMKYLTELAISDDDAAEFWEENQQLCIDFAKELTSKNRKRKRY